MMNQAVSTRKPQTHLEFLHECLFFAKEFADNIEMDNKTAVECIELNLLNGLTACDHLRTIQRTEKEQDIINLVDYLQKASREWSGIDMAEIAQLCFCILQAVPPSAAKAGMEKTRIMG